MVMPGLNILQFSYDSQFVAKYFTHNFEYMNGWMIHEIFQNEGSTLATL